MPKSKLFLMMLVALLMAFGASAVANQMMNNKLGSGKSAVETEAVSVVVAAVDIAYGQALAKENLTTKVLPEVLVPPGSITDIEEVIGKIAKGEIFEGEALLSKRLAGREEGTILAALINNNMRAVSIRVDDVIGVAGFLLPGNRVDVLASRMENRRSITRTVLQNIKVLAVDQTAEASKDKPLLVQAVTVEVSPKDSEQLFQAVQEGSIHLTLRNPVDASSAPVVSTPPKVVVPKIPEEVAKKAKSVVVQKKKVIVSKRKKRKRKARVAKKRMTKKISVVNKVMEEIPRQIYDTQPAIRQPVIKIIPPPRPVLTSKVTVIRGVTQQEVTMIRKGFPDGSSQSTLPKNY